MLIMHGVLYKRKYIFFTKISKNLEYKAISTKSNMSNSDNNLPNKCL